MTSDTDTPDARGTAGDVVADMALVVAAALLVAAVVTLTWSPLLFAGGCVMTLVGGALHERGRR